MLQMQTNCESCCKANTNCLHICAHCNYQHSAKWTSAVFYNHEINTATLCLSTVVIWSHYTDVQKTALYTVKVNLGICRIPLE